MDYIHVTHEFPPLWDPECEILILGSIPSPKSREQGFYYGHPQNRFWKVMAKVLGEAVPESIEQKRHLMLSNHIALWDSLEECDIIGAGDSSIKNPVPTDISGLIKKSRIRTIITTGTASYKYYMKYSFDKTGIEAIKLPSTSPANCAVSFKKLVEAYSIIREHK